MPSSNHGSNTKSMGELFQQRRAQASSRQQQRGRRDLTHLPLEQGVVCSLKDSFGFIHCADRPIQLFFHFSQVLGGDLLQMDDEVEFRVGPSAKDADKLAALAVRRLSPDTIVWETVEGTQVRGLVERGTRSDRDGSIRVLVEKEEANDQDTSAQDENNHVATANGPLVWFGPDDYNTEDGPRTRRGRLVRGDLVEFTMVRERRTKELNARSIRLLLSERERLRQEQEKQLLAEATLEHGVITALKGEYGFLRSNKRREEVYFHYSNIDLDASDDGEDTDGELVLKEGQDMQFLVVTEKDSESNDGRPRRRVSARQVKLQPRGSVRFHNVLATGATGIVSIVPQPQDSGHALDLQGKLVLSTPIPDSDLDGNERLVKEVYLSSMDSPGGSYSFHGGSAVGLWIEVGDTLLFDVVKDFADGACRAVPTRHLMPRENPLDLESDEFREKDNNEDDSSERAVRLINLTLTSRAEGIVNAVKEFYGFVHFAERPVDAHFKLFQLLPDELQKDLRRTMGLADVDNQGNPLKLTVGSEVQFDMSVHGSIQTHSSRQRNRHQHERENLKAQRVLLLPPNTIRQVVSLAKSVRGVISKDNPKQPYSGTLDLDKEVEPMAPEVRHPLVAAMIDRYLASDQQLPLVYHDVQSAKEDDTVIDMIQRRGRGLLSWTHIPQPGESVYPGKLCIRKIQQEEDEVKADEEAEDEACVESDEKELSAEDSAIENEVNPDGDKKRDKNGKEPGKKRSKASKPIKTVRFDKSHLSKELKNDMPPGIGDVVEFDVSQSRRTGQCQVENMKIVERKVQEVADTETSGVGIVKEVVAARQFGFISVSGDEAASNLEMLFFNLLNVVSLTESGETPRKKALPIRKGDEVKFDIGTDRNGKRVALNVALLPKGTIAGSADKNACRGYILMEPSHTSLKNTPLRQTKSNVSQTSDKGSRWDSVEEDRKSATSAEPITDNGCILLLDDPSGLFISSKAGNDQESAKSDKESASTEEPGQPIATPARRLWYKNGAIAVHGSGSSSATDESSKPRRGDLVSFVKAKKSGDGVRDIRIVERGAATLVRGHLEVLNGNNGSGSAKFIAATDGEGYEQGQVYDVALSEVVSCEPTMLKEKEPVEGILHNGSIFGICRTADLYLESKFGISNKERPKLNLTVKKDRGGTIIAQSMMAKGPDNGSNGFVRGWTKRISFFVTPFVPSGHGDETADQEPAQASTSED